jgi:predicted RNase H-like nuclease (RuvC/YqgF family)
MASPYEWRINDIERKANEAASKHEVYALRSNVDSLERTVRELSTCIDGLRATSEALLSRIEQLEVSRGDNG